MFALQLFNPAANYPPALPSTFWRFDIMGASLQFTIGDASMIGDAWNVDDPLRPWALWDPDANIPIPIGLVDWLAELGDSYGSHDVLAPDPLECVSEGTFGNDDAGTVMVRMRVKPAATFVAGTKYPFTVRVHGADGFTQDDRTFWLKLKER